MFSQNDEEKHILEYFGDKIDGRFLDIGAYNGKIFSNSHALALKGWSGVLVEPSPIPFKDLIELYRDRVDLELVNCAINGGGLVKFYDCRGDAVSSINSDHVEVWGANNKNFRQVWIKALTLDELLFQFGDDYDFITIDVEGGNIDLLEQIPARVYEEIRLFCIEHDSQQQKIQDHLAKYGFKKIHQTAENIILGK